MKHFKLRTDLTTKICGKTLFRIEATRDIEIFGVKKGELGGFIEAEANLSGNAWVYGDAKVYGNASVYGDASVYGNAEVYGNAKVYGDAKVYGNASVYGDASVYGNAKVYGDARVYGNAKVYGDKIEKENDLINITSNVGSYNITITPNHIKIGCQYHSKTAWFNFTDGEIVKMDGEKAVNWWKTWKPILQTICDGLKKNDLSHTERKRCFHIRKQNSDGTRRTSVLFQRNAN